MLNSVFCHNNEVISSQKSRFLCSIQSLTLATTHCALPAMNLLLVFHCDSSVSVFTFLFFPLKSCTPTCTLRSSYLSSSLFYFQAAGIISRSVIAFFLCVVRVIAHEQRMCVLHEGSHDRRTLGWPRWPAADTDDWSWCWDKCPRTGELTSPLKRSQAEN